jgi:hypothetical protein
MAKKNEPRDKVLQVRLTASERAKVKEIAESFGHTSSTFARLVLIETVIDNKRPVPKQVAKKE